jgi:hypothetical protein
VYSHVFAELEDGTIDIEEGIARARRGWRTASRVAAGEDGEEGRVLARAGPP